MIYNSWLKVLAPSLLPLVRSTNGMNDPFCREAIALGDLCLTCSATAQPFSLLQQLWTRRPMNRTIHATPAKRRVGGVHDCVKLTPV